MPRNAEGMLDDLSGFTPEPAPSPEPAPEPTPEPARAEADPAPTPEAPRDKPNPAASPERPDGYVPQQALAEARREAKEARERYALLEDRTAKILDRFYKEPEPQEPEIDLGPDPETDPVGAVKWMRDQQAAQIKQRHEQEQRQRQESAEEAQTRAAVHAVTDKFQQAAQARPEVQDAYQSLLRSYANELQVAGWNGDALDQQMQQIELNHIRYMAANHIEPAEYIERLAKARGWQGKANPAPTAPSTTPPRDPATGQFVSEAEKAAKIAQSQERNGSLSQAPGAPVERMTPKELASLPEEEIWRRLGAARGKGWKQFERDMGFR